MYHIEDRLEWTCAELSAVVKVCRHTAPCCYPFVFSLGARCLPAGGGREGVCKRQAIFRSSFHLPRAELHSRNRMHEHTSCGRPPARTLTRAFLVSRRPGAHNNRAKANHVLDQIRCTQPLANSSSLLERPLADLRVRGPPRPRQPLEEVGGARIRSRGRSPARGYDSGQGARSPPCSTPTQAPSPPSHLRANPDPFLGHTLVVFYEMAWMAVSVDTHTQVACTRTHSTLCGRSHVHSAATPPHTCMLMLCSCLCFASACVRKACHMCTHASARNVIKYR
jgi:hypothetical protein